jgi:Caspase domain
LADARSITHSSLGCHGKCPDSGMPHWSFKRAGLTQSRPPGVAEFTRTWRQYLRVIDWALGLSSCHSLKYAAADADLFARFLQTSRGGALRFSDQITILTNKQATRARIDDAFKYFVRDHANHQNTLILLVAAHGVYLHTNVDPVTHRIIDTDPYILTWDSHPPDAKTTGYPMAEFRNMVAAQALQYGRVLVFADVCHADNIVGIAGASQYQEAVHRVFDLKEGTLNLMVASYASKFAFEAKVFGGGHGAFSYFVISGMNGKALTFGGNSLKWSGLYQYVSHEVYQFTRGQQQPHDFPAR